MAVSLCCDAWGLAVDPGAPASPFYRETAIFASGSEVGPITASSQGHATIRERLIKIGARVIEHIARLRIHLFPERALFWQIAQLGLMPAERLAAGPCTPTKPPRKGRSIPT